MYNTILETAILNLNILDNKNIHQAPLVSAQLVVALTPDHYDQGYSQLPQADAIIQIFKADAIIYFHSQNTCADHAHTSSLYTV